MDFWNPSGLQSAKPYRVLIIDEGKILVSTWVNNLTQYGPILTNKLRYLADASIESTPFPNPFLLSSNQVMTTNQHPRFFYLQGGTDCFLPISNILSTP